MTDNAGTVPDGNQYVGQADPETGGDLFAAIDFLIRQVIAGKAFSSLVIVKSVSGGGVGSPPTIAVQPMVDQVNGTGQQTPHGTIYNIPAFRLQGGNGALILDPAVGDKGIAIICDRDISKVKATGDVSGPGSARTNDWADGCYLGGFLGGTPTTYAHLKADGMDIQTSGTIGVTATGTINIMATGAVTIQSAAAITLTSPTVINLDAPVLKNNGTIIIVP